jgi:hypothetical protein
MGKNWQNDYTGLSAGVVVMNLIRYNILYVVTVLILSFFILKAVVHAM